MSNRGLAMKVVAVGLVFAVQAMYAAAPALAADGPSGLTGSVLSSSDQAPIAGATLHVADPKTGDIVSSEPTNADGTFSLNGLPPSTYELAVESEGGLYIVSTPVELAPGQVRDVNVSINPEAAPDPATAGSQGAKKRGVWNNPLTASLIVLGAAVVVGVLIDSAVSDDNNNEPTASPMSR